MPKISQYYPSFCDGFRVSTRKFNTTKELLRVPFVKKFSEDEDFSGYALEREEHDTETTLMATYKKGKQWYVVGFINGKASTVNLPKWEAGKVPRAIS